MKKRLAMILFILFFCTVLCMASKMITAQEVYTQSEKMILMTNIMTFLKNLATGVEMYKTDNNRYPGSIREVIPHYVIDDDHYKSFTYQASSDRSSFILFFNEDDFIAKISGKIPRQYPRYDSRKGKAEYMPGITDFGSFVEASGI